MRRAIRPVFTVRRTMGVVLVAGLVFHLSRSAWQVYPGKGPHLHSWIVVEHGVASPCFDPVAGAPFLSLYWRCVLGLPWQGQAVCGGGRGELETCELDPSETFPDFISLPCLSWRQLERLRKTSKPGAPWSTAIQSIQIVVRNRLSRPIHQVEIDWLGGYRMIPVVDAGGETSVSSVGVQVASEVVLSFKYADQEPVKTRGRLELRGSERGVLTFEVTPDGVHAEGSVTYADPPT